VRTEAAAEIRGSPEHGATFPFREEVSVAVGRVRALHLCTRYLRGGSERRIADVVQALPEVEHHVIVGSESDLHLARVQLPAARVSCERSLVRQLDPVHDLLAVARVARILRRGSFDAVFTHQSKAGAIGRVAARLAGGIPVVHSLSMANFGPGYGRVEDRTFRFIERSLVRSTAAYAVVGRDLARRYEAIGAPRDKLHIVRSGARLPVSDRSKAEARRGLVARYGIPGDRPLILHLGSLDTRKNVLSLPGYLAGVSARSTRRPFLLVAGEGPMRSALDDRFTATGQAGDTRLVGFVSPVDDLVLGADAIVLLSSAEGLPQVLVQAAAARTPFVSYEVDGVAELLALGAEGSIVPPGDLNAAAGATAAYIDQPMICTAGVPRGTFADWAPDAIARGHRSVLESVLGPLPGAPVRTDDDAATGHAASVPAPIATSRRIDVAGSPAETR
jgi:glycosyltransferase involved in cell wall biosynthesis